MRKRKKERKREREYISYYIYKKKKRNMYRKEFVGKTDKRMKNTLIHFIIFFSLMLYFSILIKYKIYIQYLLYVFDRVLFSLYLICIQFVFLF